MEVFDSAWGVRAKLLRPMEQTERDSIVAKALDLQDKMKANLRKIHEITRKYIVSVPPLYKTVLR